MNAQKFNETDQRAIIVCAPMCDVSEDIHSFELGDPDYDAVVIPERYFYEFANQFAPVTQGMGVFWTTYEEDWIEKPEDLTRFLDASSCTTRPSFWPTPVHLAIAQALEALVRRAVQRTATVYFVT